MNCVNCSLDNLINYIVNKYNINRKTAIAVYYKLRNQVKNKLFCETDECNRKILKTFIKNNRLYKFFNNLSNCYLDLIIDNVLESCEDVERCSIEVTGMQAIDGGYSFDVTAEGQSMNLCYDVDGGDDVGCTSCIPNGLTVEITGGQAGAVISGRGTILTFNSSVDDCRSYCAEYVVSNYTRETTIPTIGAATVIPVPVGSPACAGTTLYTFIQAIDLVGATLNTSTGAVTVPAQVIADIAGYVYYKTCDGLLTGIFIILITNP